MNILTIVNSLGIGGIEKNLFFYLQNAQSKRINHVVCCYERGGKLEKEIRNLKIPVVFIKKSFNVFKDFWQIMKVCNVYNIDIIHSRFGFRSLGFLMVSKYLNIPLVVSYHSTKPSFLVGKKNIKLFFLRQYVKLNLFLVKKYAVKVIGHSRANLNANFTHWEENKKFQVIYNGIDFSLYQKKDLNLCRINNTFNILHIGSPRPVKNHLKLLKSYKEIKLYIPNSHLTLIGVQKNKSIYALVSKLGLNSDVTIVDFDLDVSRYLGKTDLFLFPSFYEGFGNVLIEAQYCGVPVCCSNISAFYESAYSEYHRYFFNPDSVDDIVSSVLKMEKALQTGEISSSTLTKAREFASDFSISKVVTCMEDLYKSIYYDK